VLSRVAFIKSVYWAAALVDGFVAAAMLDPRLIQPALGIATLPASPEARLCAEQCGGADVRLDGATGMGEPGARET